jgi:hypothetical protein
MKRFPVLMAAGLISMLVVPALAQAPTSNSDMAPVTGMKPDRTTAPLGVREKMREKEAAARKKRADCRAQAKAEKVPLLKRVAYIKRCVKS